MANKQNIAHQPGAAPQRQRPASRRLVGRAAVLMALVLPLGTTVSDAQTAGQTRDTPSQAREKLEKSRQELDASRQRRQGLEKSIAEIQAEREKLGDSLRETARIIHDSEKRLSEIEQHQATLATQERKIRDQLSERHGRIAVLLGAMQRMGRNPPPVMITRREDALQMVRSAMILAHAFPELAEQATALAGRLNELVKVMEASKAQSALLRAETERHEVERTRIAQLVESRRQSLSQFQPELEAAKRHASETARRIDDLTTLIARLDTGPVARGGGRPGEPGAVPVAQAPLRSDLPVPSVDLPATIPTGPGIPPQQPADAKSGPAMAQLMPSANQLVTLGTGPMRPAIPFAQTKGALPLPAQGKRVLSYGDKTQSGAQSMGMVLETRHSAQVRSPSDGWILFAGPFRTWGQLLILNADDGYHILLAGLSQIDVQVGQFVLAGEPIGLMSQAPKSTSAKAEGSAPVLYVEFRKDNRPIDPEPWWNVRS